MGRHSDNPTSRASRGTRSGSTDARSVARPIEQVAPRPAVYRRPRSRGRTALGVFAMAACAGIAMVLTADPHAVASASPSSYYRTPAAAPRNGVQRFTIDGGYVLVDAKRDTYTVVQPAAPKPRAAAASSSSAGSVAAGYTTPSGTAQAYAAEQVAGRGWASSEFTCLVDLWNRESGWNTHAENPSGAYGIPQALPGDKMGAGWQDDYRVQISWGLGYISDRYGSPCGAWAHSNAYGWY